MRGHFCLLLHAHLPFVRHPEHEDFLEEAWLYEAVVECYLPLLRMLERCQAEGTPSRLSLTLTPTLASMLSDPLLVGRCGRWLDRLVELAATEVRRTGGQAHEGLARFYLDRFDQARGEFRDRYRGDLVSAVRRLRSSGTVEVLASAATHAFLPIHASVPEAVRAQISIGVSHYRRTFGGNPAGFWLPECGYFPGVERFLAEHGIRYAIVDSHAITDARPAARYGVFAPLATSEGVVVLGRDPASSIQVWSAHHGFPGHPDYREFYRDIGYDLPEDAVRSFILDTGVRRATGIKYHRVTGPAGAKASYDRRAAVQRAQRHAREFATSRAVQFRQLTGIMGERRPVIVAPFDAELFGHWWYEGPEFLEAFFHEASNVDAFDLATPTGHLQAEPRVQVAQPPMSSWGEGGYAAVWVDDANTWMYPALFSAARAMVGLAARFGEDRHPIRIRALKQAARELLLAQSSDWAFMMKARTATAYAQHRVREHLASFAKLRDGLESGMVDEVALAGFEARNNLFPDLDPRVYCPPPGNGEARQEKSGGPPR